MSIDLVSECRIDSSNEIKEPIQTFTCEICSEAAVFTHKFSHVDADCVHNICFKCIGRHIEAKIDDNAATITCPNLDCAKTLNPVECRRMIPSPLFVKWCDCLCKSSISTYERSYCPNPNCSELILNECNETTKKCMCPGCQSLFCYTCQTPWHAGFWCSESHQERSENEVKFGFLLEQMKWSRCPNCGQPIERIAGWKNVRCRCGTRFCHGCGLSSHFGTYCGERPLTALEIFYHCCLRLSIIPLSIWGLFKKLF